MWSAYQWSTARRAASADLRVQGARRVAAVDDGASNLPDDKRDNAGRRHG